jgi:glycosyltransferase involved in cell wall biosynthesis
VRRVATSGIEHKSLTTLTHGATAIWHAARHDFDVLLILNIAHGPFLPLLARTGTPFALNVDGLEWKRGKWGPVGRRFLRYAARQTARHTPQVVVDSEAIGSVWKREFGVESRFIPYGADVVESDGARTAELGLRGRDYVLVVARLVPENNVDLALDALDVLERRGRRPHAVIVGGATCASRLARRLEHLARRDDLHWLGHVSDQELLVDLWANAGVYVHGHSAGGTNPALLQALGAGAPTVALDTPFNREVLHPHLGALFRHDSADLAAAISATLDRDGTRHVAGADGRAIVLDRFRWDQICERYHETLVELAAQHPERGWHRRAHA